LDMSRVVSGRMRLVVQPVDLRDLIEDALEAVRHAAEAKRIRLQPVLEAPGLLVSGDPGRLQQIIWNLLENAVKFTPKDGRVQVQLQRVRSHVEIIVSDTGQGIAADVLPYVFDRLRQGESGSTRVHGVLVSDIEMPGQDGYSLIRKVRALGPERGGKTPAVALTAFGRPQDRIRSLTAGFNIHVSKPVDPAELIAIVASMIGRAG